MSEENLATEALTWLLRRSAAARAALVGLARTIGVDVPDELTFVALHRSSFSAVAWQPALRGAGLPCSRENGMHALRHYFASACLHNGVDIRALASYLGHSDPGFTLRTYVHLMPSAGHRMRQAVDAAFASPDGPATARQGVR